MPGLIKLTDVLSSAWQFGSGNTSRYNDGISIHIDTLGDWLWRSVLNFGAFTWLGIWLYYFQLSLIRHTSSGRPDEPWVAVANWHYYVYVYNYNYNEFDGDYDGD